MLHLRLRHPGPGESQPSKKGNLPRGPPDAQKPDAACPPQPQASLSKVSANKKFDEKENPALNKPHAAEDRALQGCNLSAAAHVGQNTGGGGGRRMSASRLPTCLMANAENPPAKLVDERSSQVSSSR
jgi:hypothetical protein